MNHHSDRLSTFESLAPELIVRIALSAVADDHNSLGPPTVLFSLLLTSKRIHFAINLTENCFLQAHVFRLSFDLAAPTRRLGSSWTTPQSLAAELRKRFEALKRIRSQTLDAAHLLSDLSTVFLMMLENDGLNERQVLDWARLPAFLRTLMQSINCNNPTNSHSCLSETPGLPLVIWLLWLTSSANELSQETPEERNAIKAFLFPFVVAGYRFPSFHAPDAHFEVPIQLPCIDDSTTTFVPTSFPIPSRTPLPGSYRLTHYGRPLAIAFPPTTGAAFLTYTARLEAEGKYGENLSLPPNRETAIQLAWLGPTMADLDEFNSTGRTRLPVRFSEHIVDASQTLIHDGAFNSKRLDPDWYRIVSCLNPFGNDVQESPLRGSVFVPGILSGLWAGRLMVPYTIINPFQELFSQVALSSKPQFFRLREHHCLDTDCSISSGEDQVETDHLFNAWFPVGTTWTEKEDEHCLEIFDPHTRKRTRYDTFIPDKRGGGTYPGVDWKRIEKIQVAKPFKEHNFVSRTSHACGRHSERSAEEERFGEDAIQCKLGVRDIVLTGSTDERHGNAWNHFSFVGRVRPWDGLVNLLSIPRPDQSYLGRWAFRGYITSSRNLVGRWRDTSTGVHVTGLEGPYVVSNVEE